MFPHRVCRYRHFHETGCWLDRFPAEEQLNGVIELTHVLQLLEDTSLRTNSGTPAYHLVVDRRSSLLTQTITLRKHLAGARLVASCLEGNRAKTLLRTSTPRIEQTKKPG